MRMKDYVETIAEEFKVQLNELGIDLRMDYDDDQSEKIEAGRKLGRRWYRQYKALIKE